MLHQVGYVNSKFLLKLSGRIAFRSSSSYNKIKICQ